MRLLLSLFDDPIALSNGKSTDRKSSLLLVDTSSGKIRFVESPVLQSPHGGITGMDYSGKWLCCNLFNVDIETVYSYLYLINISSGKTCLHDLKFIHYGHDVVSVYPGQVYINCIATDTMSGVLFSHTTGQCIREDLHYTIPNGGVGTFGFNSMCSYRNKWYASFMKDNNDQYNGVVLELSTQRAIYSNLNKPNSLFFNFNHRLCFCEGGAGNIHIGDNIFYIGGYPQGIIEDLDLGGYWVAIHLLPYWKTVLAFVDYGGRISNVIELNDLKVFKIIEAKGKWLAQLI